MDLYSTATRFDGIAAAADLDALLSSDDFAPSHEIDTDSLDATIAALEEARALVANLEALRAHLAAAGDDSTATGLAIDVHASSERLGVALVDVAVAGTFEPRKGVVL